MDTTYTKVFWVKIIVKTDQGPNGDVIQKLYWKDLPYQTRLKFDWYFKYRAALAQVQNPKAFVDFAHGSEQGSVELARIQKRNQLISARAQVTKIQNALDKFVQNWNSLFPIEEDADYKKALGKLSEYLIKVKTLEDEISETR